MFDFIRNLGRSGDQRQQETLSAYLDNELAPADRERFELQLAQNSDLQDELAEMQFWQQQMRTLPARRVPRNFTLDPAIYGRQQRQPLGVVYPVLRTATAVSAFLFVIALAANLFLGDTSEDTTAQPVSVAMQEMAPAAEGEALDGATVGDMEVAAEEPPETFVLEESGDVEADEVPVEIVETEAEEAQVESVEEEVLSAANEVVEGEELLSEQPLELSQTLELEAVDETDQPEMARESGTDPQQAPTAAELRQAEEAPQPTVVPDQAEVQIPLPAEGQKLIQPVVREDAAPDAPFSMSGVLSPIAIGLGLLFVFLTVLTLFVRGRK